jgi:hypothetical protein
MLTCLPRLDSVSRVRIYNIIRPLTADFASSRQIIDVYSVLLEKRAGMDPSGKGARDHLEKAATIVSPLNSPRIFADCECAVLPSTLCTSMTWLVHPLWYIALTLTPIK